MRVRLSTFLIVLAVELLALAGTIGVVRELRYARMRANCVNGLKEQLAGGHAAPSPPAPYRRPCFRCSNYKPDAQAKESGLHVASAHSFACASGLW
ncbi:MAG: hypothetical protein L0211_02670 [Planctomycetaceae bacterium]|nr:hypothetical protein [Planctomycetaceae bacterium]